MSCSFEIAIIFMEKMQAGRTLALRKYTFVVHDWLIGVRPNLYF